jgi:hypothetical protein
MTLVYYGSGHSGADGQIWVNGDSIAGGENLASDPTDQNQGFSIFARQLAAGSETHGKLLALAMYNRAVDPDSLNYIGNYILNVATEDHRRRGILRSIREQ